MVAEEDSVALKAPEGRAMLLRITDLINAVLMEEEGAVTLSPDDVIALIGG